MLMVSADPSPLVQTAIYMAGVLAGYVLLVRPDEWQQAWDLIRNTWAKPPRE